MSGCFQGCLARGIGGAGRVQSRSRKLYLGTVKARSRQWSIGLTGRWAYSPVPLTFLPSSYTGLPGATVTRGKDRHEVAASLGKRLAGITGLWTCWVHAALEFSIPTRYCKMQYNTQPCKAKKHMTASGGPAGGKRCRGARIATLQTRLTLSSRVALRCFAVHSCDRPTAGSVLT